MSSTDPELYGNPGNIEGEVETVRAIYAAFAARDVEAALGYVADDCEFDLPGTGSLAGRTRPYLGRDGVRQYFVDAGRVWDELALHADDIRAVSGGVVVFGHIDGQRGAERVRRRVVWLWQLRDGQAVHVRANELGDGERLA